VRGGINVVRSLAANQCCFPVPNRGVLASLNDSVQWSVSNNDVILSQLITIMMASASCPLRWNLTILLSECVPITVQFVLFFGGDQHIYKIKFPLSYRHTSLFFNVV
jgi:hypothetical protein